MKDLIRKWNRMCRGFVRWIWEQCKDWKTIVLLLIVSAVLYSPAIVCWTLFFIFKWDWAWITATAYSAFWIGPGTPFFVISVTVTLAIKRFIQHLFGKKNPEADTETEKSTESSDAATDTVSENASTDASAGQTPTASEESTAAESESADQESFTTESESDGDNV